jgi:predicted RNase H-like nuclease (RuvC/YqgF family)
VSEPIAWKELESTVERAATRLGELQQENAGLKRRVAELERALAAQGGEVESRWQQERDEVAQRVDGLVERLEAILATVSDESST